MTIFSMIESGSLRCRQNQLRLKETGFNQEPSLPHCHSAESYVFTLGPFFRLILTVLVILLTIERDSSGGVFYQARV